MPTSKKIIIIEDNKDLNELYSLAFEEAGFEVQTSLMGLDGFKKTMEWDPDVVLLDLMMPVMDGFQVLEELRKNKFKKLIIVNSNLDQESDIKRAMKLGADKYFVKSNYIPSKLIKEVEKLMKK